MRIIIERKKTGIQSCKQDSMACTNYSNTETQVVFLRVFLRLTDAVYWLMNRFQNVLIIRRTGIKKVPDSVNRDFYTDIF